MKVMWPWSSAKMRAPSTRRTEANFPFCKWCMGRGGIGEGGERLEKGRGGREEISTAHKMNLCHAFGGIRPRADVVADEKEAFDRRKGEGEGTLAHNRGGLEKRTRTEDRFCGIASRSKKLYGRPPKPKRRGGRTSRVVIME